MRATIVTPTFQAVRFIEACIVNVASQGSVVLEHIIADGGSTDGTVELIEKLQRTQQHVRLLRGPDSGQSDAMNKATTAAKGDVIGILNADDFYEAGAVSSGVTRLEIVGKAALVCGDCRILDEYGITRLINKPVDLRIEALLQNSWMFPIPANPSAYFYTKDVHTLVGGYDINDSYAMDCDFILTAAERVKMIYVPQLWGNFRYIPGCKTFDDTEGPARVTALIEQHKLHLTPRQKRRMLRLRTQRELRLKSGNLLRKLGLRR